MTLLFLLLAILPVNPDSVRATIQRLQDFGTRYATTYACRQAAGADARMVRLTLAVASAAQVTLDCEAAGAGSWLLGAGVSKVAAIAGPDDDAGSYISRTGNNGAQTFTLSDPDIPVGSVVDSVKVSLRAKRGGASNGIVRGRVYLGTAYTATVSATATSVWRTVTSAVLACPGGVPWTVPAVRDLRVAVVTGNSNEVQVTSLSVTVYYSPPPWTRWVLTESTLVVPQPGYRLTSWGDDSLWVVPVANQPQPGVSVDSVYATILRLQKFYTRTKESDSLWRAVAWLGDRLTAWGYEVSFPSWRTGYAPSVVATRWGAVHPERSLIVCAHTDDYADYYSPRPGYAPGADDNASGCAATLEAARVMAGWQFDATVRFCLFSGEERGSDTTPSGGSEYARLARANGDSILGVLCLDAIGHSEGGGETLMVIGKPTNPACGPLVDAFISAAGGTGLTCVKVLDSTRDNSDHGDFWRYGYPALWVFDWRWGKTLHTVGDSLGPLHYSDCGVNDWPQVADVARAVVETVKRLAILKP